MGVQINGSEGNVIATKGTFSGDVGIGGTLTYEDVTNIDSVGLVTARSGIEVGARPGVAASISVDGNMIVSGISTFNDKVLLGTTTEGTSNADDLTVATSGHTGITIRSGTSNQGNIFFSDGTSGADEYRGYLQYEHTANALIVGTDGSERLRIDSNGYLIAKADIRLRRTASDNGALYFGDTNNNYIFGSDADDVITFATAGSERLRITSDGNVRVGTAASTAGLRYLDVSNTSNAADTHGSLLRLITSNAANTGTTSVDIVKYKDGNFYINNMESSGSTNFYNGGATRMTINSTGAITIGGSGAAGGGMFINGGTNDQSSGQDAALYVKHESAADWGMWLHKRYEYGFRLDSTSSATLAFAVYDESNTQKLRIQGNGNVFGSALGVFASGLTQVDNSQSLISQSSTGSSSTTYYIGNQAIQTSSDRRIKENIIDTEINALSKLEKVKVVDFDWNDPSDTSINNKNSRGKWTGCIAQEIVDVFPHAVNAPRPEGKEIDHNSEDLWTIQYEHLVPVLIKAVQELSAEVKSLKQKKDN